VQPGLSFVVEWAEGNYLEPDAEHGRADLEALRDVVCRPRSGMRA
jgi:hypothetical protein